MFKIPPFEDNKIAKINKFLWLCYFFLNKRKKRTKKYILKFSRSVDYFSPCTAFTTMDREERVDSSTACNAQIEGNVRENYDKIVIICSSSPANLTPKKISLTF